MDYGESFEIDLCCLVYLRCLRRCDSFYLASNHGAAGSFDDLVLYWKPRGDDNYYACFVQCKYKSKNPPNNALFKADKDFGLHKYFLSYLESKDRLRCLSVSSDKNILTDRCSFVIFTNTQVPVSTQTYDITGGYLKDVLDTGGYMKVLSNVSDEDSSFEERHSPGWKQFVHDFVLCDQQANNVNMENMIKREIQVMLSVEHAKAKDLYSNLWVEMKNWCQGREGRIYLTENSPMWQDVLSICNTTPINQNNIQLLEPMKYMSLSETSEVKEQPQMWRHVQNTCNNTGIKPSKPQSKLLAKMKIVPLNADCKVVQADSAIHLAARKGHIATLNELLNQGVDIETLGARQMTPLHCAAFKGRYDATSLLLERGADVHRRSAEFERTALHYVAVRGRRDVMALLLRRGGVVDNPDSKGDLPLHIAAWKGHTGLLEDILDAGTDVNASGHWNRTALHWAAQVGHLDIITVLLKRGADTSARDQSGKTALDLARTKGNDGAVKILLSHLTLK